MYFLLNFRSAGATGSEFNMRYKFAFVVEVELVTFRLYWLCGGRALGHLLPRFGSYTPRECYRQRGFVVVVLDYEFLGQIVGSQL